MRSHHPLTQAHLPGTPVSFGFPRPFACGKSWRGCLMDDFVILAIQGIFSVWASSCLYGEQLQLQNTLACPLVGLLVPFLREKAQGIQSGIALVAEHALFIERNGDLALLVIVPAAFAHAQSR